MKKPELFLKSVAGGVCISIGGCVYIATENKVAGAILFAVGLFAICVFGLGLFTGKIGYFFDEKGKKGLSYKLDCLIVWLGNLTGTVLSGVLVRVARPNIADTAVTMTENKLAIPFYSALILGFFCGVLMYIAVHNYRTNTGAGRYIGIFTAVPVFILAGFEHSVADMFYLSAGLTLDKIPQGLLFLLLVSLGNGIGAIILRLLSKKAEAGK